jgi:DNA-binding response OmpR family regulator
MAKILIIEDDPLMSRMYEKIFIFEKYEVETAHDGEEGLEKVRTIKPTVILLDVMMPKLNGFQLLDKIKIDPELKKIPVIMLTNLASEKDAENAMLKGAVKYIIKSDHDPKEIVKMVKEILDANTRDEVPTAGVVQAPISASPIVTPVTPIISPPKG